MGYYKAIRTAMEGTEEWKQYKFYDKLMVDVSMGIVRCTEKRYIWLENNVERSWQRLVDCYNQGSNATWK